MYEQQNVHTTKTNKTSLNEISNYDFLTIHRSRNNLRVFLKYFTA